LTGVSDGDHFAADCGGRAGYVHVIAAARHPAVADNALPRSAGAPALDVNGHAGSIAHAPAAGMSVQLRWSMRRYNVMIVRADIHMTSAVSAATPDRTVVLALIAIAFVAAVGAVLGVVAVVRSRRKRHLAQLALRDSLTGVGNR